MGGFYAINRSSPRPPLSLKFVESGCAQRPQFSEASGRVGSFKLVLASSYCADGLGWVLQSPWKLVWKAFLFKVGFVLLTPLG